MKKNSVVLTTMFCFAMIFIQSSITICQQNRETVRKYTIKEGDTLWDLSKKFYGDALKWPRILESNPSIGTTVC